MDYLNFLKHFLTSFLFIVVMYSTTFGVAQNNQPLSTRPENLANTYHSGVLYNHSVQVAKRELLIASTNFDKNGRFYKSVRRTNGMRALSAAIRSCRQILDLALYYLDWAIPTNGTNDLTKPEKRENFRTWISGVGSLLESCKDEFDDTSGGVKEVVDELLENSARHIYNSLDIMYQIIINSNETQSLGMEKTNSYKSTNDWPPTWFSGKGKMLLEDPAVAYVPNVVVAADGSGNYTTITEALSIVPHKSDKRFVIYVKTGVYNERVIVHKKKWNVLMYGDGMNNTIVSGHRNVAAGIPTFQSATLSAFGKGFVAAYMTFQNTAGPQGGQAVAVLSTADQSVFYRCRIDGYQDTLYAHSMVQFYRECEIYGTVDFIFGRSSVVIQNSDIIVKRPMPGQHNVITAQGKNQSESNSAISIQNCRIIPNENLTGVETYLGRPWRNYSTTIFMESFIGSFIHPQGWLNWFRGVTPPNTIYYAEYLNYGPGANTLSRVDWEGVQRDLCPEEANQFTVTSLLRGDEWIPEIGVPFQADL